MIAEFRRRYPFAQSLRVFRAPGRVNVIGEHTDYNSGFVLPVALDLAAYVAAAPSGDGRLRIYSEDRHEAREFDAAGLAQLAPAHHWTDYVIGVAREVIRAGYEIEPANLLIRATVPEGAGLSSSAALEVSSALAFLAGRPIRALDLARLCQRAERNFVAVPCGIMDQYISVFGREHCAVEIDCRSLGHRLVSLPEGVAFIAVNTGVKHALAGSAYKDRVRECATAVEILQTRFPGIESLRDVTPGQLDASAHLLPGVVARRARHIVTENVRVCRFVEASQAADLVAMGRLLVESHRSLRDDYQVSCLELDFLADTALAIDGVYGSRMTGGGFGGCTVTMLRAAAAQYFRERISSAYQGRFGAVPKIYDCKPTTGAGECKNLETIPALV